VFFDDEGSACVLREAEKSRFFTEFNLSRARSFAALRMTGEGLRMTVDRLRGQKKGGAPGVAAT
jgi:hypothetical protein